MARRDRGAAFIVPAVVHWKAGHYAALLRQKGDRFLVKDRTFQSSLWVSISPLEKEHGGYYRVPSGTLPAGWRPVSESESQTVHGKGQVSGQDPGQTGSAAYVIQSGGTPGGGGDSPDNPGSIGGGGGKDTVPNSCGGSDTPITPGPFRITTYNGATGQGVLGVRGMTGYTFDTMLASLCLNDNPVGYKPPVGPGVEFT